MGHAICARIAWDMRFVPAKFGPNDPGVPMPQWAESGDCRANAIFMVGKPQQPGSCLFACGR